MSHKAIIHTLDHTHPMDRIGEFPEEIDLWIDAAIHKHPIRKRFGAGRREKARLSADRRQILVLMEPDSISEAKGYILPKGHEVFDAIFTFDQEVLDLVGERSHLLPFGYTYIGDDEEIPEEKSPTISLICGHKIKTEGHKLRWDAWQQEESWPLPLYRCKSKLGGPETPQEDATLGDSKMAAFESAFHLTIENCRIPNYFTEKLIDCFITGVVPIYWGCTNIGEFFDERGIIQIESLEQIAERFPKDWNAWIEERREAMEFNAKKSLEYINYYERVGDAIRDFLRGNPRL